MFDYIKCSYPLPETGANALDYQTKDTPSQFMDVYEIREDGTLWVENYDVEDHSKLGLWKRENPGKELPEGMNNLMDAFAGSMTRVNKHWVQEEDFTGEIVFYNCLTKDHKGWIEWSSYFEHGKLVRLNLLRKTDK